MAAYSTTPSPVASRISRVYRTATAIVPADATAIGPFMGFIPGAAGNVALVPLGTATPVVIAVLAGVLYEIAFQGINATSTTATGIVGVG